MARVVKLYHRDGTYIKDLPATNVRVEVDRQRAVRRSAAFRVPGSSLADVKVLGRRIRIYDGATQLFGGYIDTPQVTVGPQDIVVDVACRDKAKPLKLARFTQDTTYEDLSASESGNLVAAATASTEMAVGGQIQQYAKVYRRDLSATVLGVSKSVDATEGGDLRDGTYQADYSEAGLTEFRVQPYIDLRATESVQTATVTTNGTVSAMEVSTDGVNWVAYAAGSWRYLRFTIARSSGPITAGVAITTAASYPASNVLTDSADSWRPTASDLARYIDLDFGSAQTVNVLYLRWGINSQDRTTRYVYGIEGSTDKATWTALVASADATASQLVEHVLTSGSYRYLRVTLLQVSGPIALRFAKAQNIVSTTSIHTLIQQIAESEGETLFRLTTTRQYAKAITFEAGEEKWAAMQELAATIGWELFYSADEYLTLRPSDIDMTDPAIPTYKALFSFDAEYSDAEVYNQVIGVYESATVTYRSVQEDNNAFSATGIPRLGRRTAPVQKNPLADSQQKLDAWTLDLLGRYTRQTTQVSFSMSAAPTHEAGDVIRLEEAQTGTAGYFTLEAFELVEEPDAGTYDLNARVVQEVV